MCSVIEQTRNFKLKLYSKSLYEKTKEFEIVIPTLCVLKINTKLILKHRLNKILCRWLMKG